MTSSPTAQPAALEAAGFDELSRSFRGKPPLPTRSGYEAVNFLGSDDDTGRVREAYGDHIHRRRGEVKAKYDPDTAFRHNKNIRPCYGPGAE